MGRDKAKKRGSSIKSKSRESSSERGMSRLDLLKRKLELEQEMIEQGKMRSMKQFF